MSHSKPQTSLKITKLTDQSFAPYGKIIWEKAAEDPAAAKDEWTVRARKLLGAQELDARSFALTPKPNEFDKVEVHHKSHQLTIALGAPWVVACFTNDMSASDRIDPSTTAAFEIPPRVGLLIHAGVWHGGLNSEKGSDALVFFLPGTTQTASSVRELAQSVKLLPT